MKRLRIIYGAGCWFFGILSGIGHTVFELGPKPASIHDLILAQQQTIISMPGTETSVYRLTLGVSLIMGLMLLGYGVTHFAILLSTPKQNLPSLPIQIINLIFVIAAFVLTINYLFMVPIVLTGLATLCFAFVLIATLTNTKAHQ